MIFLLYIGEGELRNKRRVCRICHDFQNGSRWANSWVLRKEDPETEDCLPALYGSVSI